MAEALHNRAEIAADEALVAAALEEGPPGFGPIIERYKDAVFGVALARLGDADEAADVAQNTFVEAFERLKNLKDARRLGAWLRSIAIHRTIDWQRRQGREVALESVAEPLAREPTPAAGLERQELRQQVMEAIGRLPRTQRETVALYYVGGHSQEEVAAILEVPLGTVKRRLHEARQRLREELLEMVEEVLNEKRPKEDFGQRVFELICQYPDRPFRWDEAVAELRRIGAPGVDGFIRAMELPHWQTRRTAAQMVKHALPDRRKAVVELLKKGLRDENRKVRGHAAVNLMYMDVAVERKRREFAPLVVPLLLDRSRRVRRRVAMLLQGAWGEADLSDLVPMETVAEALLKEEEPLTRQWLERLMQKVLEARKKK
jgi:RNA polymerase sigma-70 factor (ECF subfamily)